MYITASNLSKEEMNLLQTKDSDICISIIIPLTDNWNKQPFPEKLEQSFQNVVHQLEQLYPEAKVELENKLMNLYKKFPLQSIHPGIGIYISQTIEYVAHFPYPVEEKISISNHFELRDILFKANYSEPYYVILLDGKQAILYSGLYNKLQKIKDTNFPASHFDDYEYQPPSRSNSYYGSSEISSFEKDKSTVQKSRYLSFLKHVDDMLDLYLLGKDAQLIICGVRAVTASFLNHSKHDAKVAGVLSGNFSHLSETDLSERVLPVLQAAHKENMLEDISDFEEKMGEGLADEGLYDVWQSIIDGRGKILLVEKDYEDKAYYEKNYPLDIQMKPTRRANCIVENPVDKLMAIHLNKKGKIAILANGMLSQHKKIALIRRY